ncbi:MAG: hypothetical protein ACYTFV_10255 [Planctomycetota bacterium]|jgi:hypothetical protein
MTQNGPNLGFFSGFCQKRLKMTQIWAFLVDFPQKRPKMAQIWAFLTNFHQKSPKMAQIWAFLANFPHFWSKMGDFISGGLYRGSWYILEKAVFRPFFHRSFYREKSRKIGFEPNLEIGSKSVFHLPRNDRCNFFLGK